MTPVLLTVKEVQAALRCSLRHAYKIIQDGDVPSARIANKLVVREEDLKWYINRHFGDPADEATNGSPSETLRDAGHDAVSAQRTRRKLLAS